MEYRSTNIEQLVGKHFRNEPLELYNLNVRGVSYDDKERRFTAIAHTSGQANLIFLRGKMNPDDSERFKAFIDLMKTTGWQASARGIYNTRTFAGKDNSSGELEVHFLQYQNIGFYCIEEDKVRTEEKAG